MAKMKDFIKQSATRTEIINFLTATATANSETDMEPLLDLFTPVEDRDQMSDKFEATLGYDPITHYDMRDVLNAVDEVLGQVSESGVTIIKEHRDEIAQKAMEIYASKRDDNLREALSIALADYLDSDDNKSAAYFLTDKPPVTDFVPDDEDAEDDDGDDILPDLGDSDDDTLSDIDGDDDGLSLDTLEELSAGLDDDDDF